LVPEARLNLAPQRISSPARSRLTAAAVARQQPRLIVANAWRRSTFASAAYDCAACLRTDAGFGCLTASEVFASGAVGF
jgi:hypothetical protein